jgi:uncharacterized protein (TIGR02646 family)
MIRLDSKDLPPTVQTQLNSLQKKVDAETTFAKKAEKAQRLWDSKGGKRGEEAFEKIVQMLESMCVYVKVCNYCEHSEANDVEHIYPKSFFPEYAFRWDNYLLACKQCNSAYKIDTFYVLDAQDNAVKLERGLQPPYQTFAFINPRTDNPNRFMILNTLNFEFILLPDLSRGDENKAIKTIEVLQLNNRDLLLAARESAATYYYMRMEKLTHILAASDKHEIFRLLTPYDKLLNAQLSLEQLKEQLKSSYKKDITTYKHPSVWHSIKVIDSKTNPKWQTIFAQLPEALHW